MTALSPCTTCADVARDCGTCALFGAWLAVTDPTPPPCPVCEDVDWLTISGEDFDTICARIKVKRASLRTHLHRHGRPDLVPRPVLGVAL